MSLALLHRSAPWSFDDLDQHRDDGRRYEVVDGALLMTPPPTDHHPAVSRRLFRQLDRKRRRSRSRSRRWLSGSAPTAACQTWLSSGPGLRFAPREVTHAVSDFGLLIEIVSPTSTGMDRVLKPAEYAAAGVPYYWRVETEPAVEVMAYELVDGAYRETGRLSTGSGSLPAPYPVVIDVSELAGA
jgi:Uma2 family endonuclease